MDLYNKLSKDKKETFLWFGFGIGIIIAIQSMVVFFTTKFHYSIILSMSSSITILISCMYFKISKFKRYYLVSHLVIGFAIFVHLTRLLTIGGLATHAVLWSIILPLFINYFLGELKARIFTAFGTGYMTFFYFYPPTEKVSFSYYFTLVSIMWIVFLFSKVYEKQKEQFIVGLKKEHSNKIQSLAFNTMKEMTDGFAHEINNNLFILNSLIEKTHMRGQSISDKDFDLFSRRVDEVTNLVSFLKDQTSKTKKTTNKKNISLNKVMEDLIRDFYSNLQEQDIKVIWNDNNNYIIKGDEEEIFLIFRSLLQNSIDSLKGSKNKFKKITIKINPKDRTISFSDNGIGIPNDIQDKIFNTFFTTKKSGTGLGLSLSKRILKNNNATLELTHSVANVETSFIIDFSENS